MTTLPAGPALQIGSLNVQRGFAGKLRSNPDYYYSLIRQHDLFFFIDVCLTKIQARQMTFPGQYDFYHHARGESSKNGRATGGILAVWHRKLNIEIRTQHSSSQHLWLELGSSINICGVYCPPVTASSADRADPFDELRPLLTTLIDNSTLPTILLGDFNARVGNRRSTNCLATRSCLDKHSPTGSQIYRTNEFLQFCQENALQIANGNLEPDRSQGGRFTHVHHAGARSTRSVIDYCLISDSIWEHARAFKVLDFDSRTDHAVISASVAVPSSLFSATNLNPNLPRPRRAPPKPAHNMQQVPDKCLSALESTGFDQKTSMLRLLRPVGRIEGNPITAYTDGSARRGRNPSAGAGVHFPNAELQDISVRVDGEQTNGRAELLAVYLAIQATPPARPLEIWSDSTHAINAVARWISVWCQTGWQALAGPAAHPDILKGIAAALQLRSAPVIMHWVKGHSDNAGNDAADKLAKAGCEKLPEVLELPKPLPCLPANTFPRNLHVSDLPPLKITTSLSANTREFNPSEVKDSPPPSNEGRRLLQEMRRLGKRASDPSASPEDLAALKNSKTRERRWRRDHMKALRLSNQELLLKSTGSKAYHTVFKTLLGRKSGTHARACPHQARDYFSRLYSGTDILPHFDKILMRINDIRAGMISTSPSNDETHPLNALCTVDEIATLKDRLRRNLSTSKGPDGVSKDRLFWVDNDIIRDLFNDILRNHTRSI